MIKNSIFNFKDNFLYRYFLQKAIFIYSLKNILINSYKIMIVYII